MRKPVRRILWLVVILALLAGVLVHMAKGPLLRAVTIRMVEAATGFGVEVEKVDVRLLSRTVDFYGIRLINPDGFVEREAMSIRRLHVETTWKSLWEEMTHFKKLEIEVPTLVLVYPKSGPSNFDLLGINLEDWQTAPTRPPAHTGPHPARPPVAAAALRHIVQLALPRNVDEAQPLPVEEAHSLQIDELRLWLGDITVIDYRLGRQGPVTLTQPIQREQVYSNVTDLDALSEDLAIDFTVDSFVAGIADLEEFAPELKVQLREWMDAAEERAENADPEEIEDAVELFKDLLPERGNLGGD